MSPEEEEQMAEEQSPEQELTYPDESQATGGEVSAEEMLPEGAIAEGEEIPVPRGFTLPPIPIGALRGAGGVAESGLARVGAIIEPRGAVRSSTLEANGDDLSDLFEGPQPNDLDINIDDLVNVDEEDVFGDGGEDMSDLVAVSYEDIMGEPPPRKIPRKASRRSSYGYPAGMSGLQ